MAAAFREIFGDMMLIEPVDSNGSALPSPNQLKRKIIIKVAFINAVYCIYHLFFTEVLQTKLIL